MEIAVLGTGSVGRTLATRLVELGHDVALGTRDPDATRAQEEYAAWAASAPAVRLTGFADAAQGCDLAVAACSGAAAVDVVGAAAPGLEGKVLLDLTNPLDFSGGFPPTLFVKDTDSLAEVLQRAHPGVRVVKALNTMAASVMVHPETLPEQGTAFVCGDDPGARAAVAGLLAELGHADVLDLGPLEAARGTEMYLPLWLRIMGALGTGDFQVRVVRPG